MSSGDGDSGVSGTGFGAEITAAVASLEAAVSVLQSVDSVGLSNADRRALVTRCETVSRVLFGLSHTWIADLVSQRGLDEIPGTVPQALSALLHVSSARAGQRIRYAEQFGQRSAPTGERLEPVLSSAGGAAVSGALDEEHQKIIRDFFRTLGSAVDVETRESAETQLVTLAGELSPDHFRVAARRLFDILEPDGTDVDEEVLADRCYVVFSEQDRHGHSKGRMVVDAETRAYIEAAFAKFAKPGIANGADPRPVVDEEPDGDGSDDDGSDGDGSDGDGSDGDGGSGGTGSEATLFDDSDMPASTADADTTADADADATAGRAERDRRSVGRRQHDALKLILRQMLASGQLGQHRGLPVTAVITMSLEQLETAAGFAVTATGSLVRMRDAIRMASHAHHYLTVFDDKDGRALHLGRTKRIASPDQRMVLIASERGCSFAGCRRPAVFSQVHHTHEWGTGGSTDIDDLTFACDIHHRLAGPGEGQWATSTAGPEHPYPGRTLWHPPATLDPRRKGLVNHYHHPHEYIYPTPDAPNSGAPNSGAPKPGARRDHAGGEAVDDEDPPG